MLSNYGYKDDSGIFFITLDAETCSNCLKAEPDRVKAVYARGEK